MAFWHRLKSLVAAKQKTLRVEPTMPERRQEPTSPREVAAQTPPNLSRGEARTVLSTARAVTVRFEKDEARKRQNRFERNFTLGRGPQCDIQFNDPQVSMNHAEIVWESGCWWVKDLQSTNGTYLNGERVNRAILPQRAKLELARDGPALIIEIEHVEETIMAAPPQEELSLTKIAQRYFGPAGDGMVGERTMLIRQAFQKVRRKQSKRYWVIIGIIFLLLLGASGALYYQHQRLKKLHALAEDIFYAMKSLELQISPLQSAVAQQPDSRLKKQIAERLQQQRELRERYSNFARELGIAQDKLSQEEWLIYKIARLFGECDASMPPGFVRKVRQYIRKWQSTSRLGEAIERAKNNGYAPKIVEEMIANDMPPQFFYLALQESDFDLNRCGPSTRYGIAKGMWQFIPSTGRQYGLRTGPLVELRRSDPRDERHNFEKATRAAAKYLRDLYETEAQASGLLVIASYNWGEGNVRALIRRMPENPRERNFWRLLTREKIPQQTYDYVFYIISAAVIGEDPRLFGFDFDNPLNLK